MRNYAAGQEALIGSMTLFRGDREIRILFFGRGHTGGDSWCTWQERVIVTGDLLVPGLPYMGDGYLAEWVETLEHVKGLSTGCCRATASRSRTRSGYLQDYMRDLQARAAELHARGMSYEEAAAQIDMTDHAYADHGALDGGSSPAAAHAVVEEIKALTDRPDPVRGQHALPLRPKGAHGNQIYPDDVHVIGHDESAREIAGERGVAGAVVRAVRGSRLPDQIARRPESALNRMMRDWLRSWRASRSTSCTRERRRGRGRSRPRGGSGAAGPVGIPPGLHEELRRRAGWGWSRRDPTRRYRSA